MIYTMVLTKVTVGVVLDWGTILSSAFVCLLFNFCPHIQSFSPAYLLLLYLISNLMGYIPQLMLCYCMYPYTFVICIFVIVCICNILQVCEILSLNLLVSTGKEWSPLRPGISAHLHTVLAQNTECWCWPVSGPSVPTQHSEHRCLKTVKKMVPE